MSTLSCHVQSITALTPTVYKIILNPEQAVSFAAGQYLNIVMSEQDKRPFSIANGPDDNHIELQIGAFGEESYAMQVIDRLKNNDSIEIEIPLGNAQLRESSTRPILLIAGGTGFSYIKSIAERLVAINSSLDIRVYWGLREQSACFDFERSQQTINQLAHGQFHVVIENADENWAGKHGLVHEAVMTDIKNLADFDIYLAGRFDMVGKIREDFVKKGALVDRMFADAFAFI